MPVEPKQGEIWWADLDPTVGSELRKRRPVVVLGLDAVNARRRTVIIVPLSSKPRAFPPVSIPMYCKGE